MGRIERALESCGVVRAPIACGAKSAHIPLGHGLRGARLSARLLDWMQQPSQP
jgi:hypothetical protein